MSYLRTFLQNLTYYFTYRSNAKVTWKGDVPVTTPALQRSQETSKLPMCEETSNSLFDTSCASSNSGIFKKNPNRSNIKQEPHWNDLDELTQSDCESDNDISNNTESDDEAFHQAVNTFKDLCKTREKLNDTNCAIDGFIHMIMSIIENMSPAKRTKAMLKVIEILMKIKQEND